MIVTGLGALIDVPSCKAKSLIYSQLLIDFMFLIDGCDENSLI